MNIKTYTKTFGDQLPREKIGKYYYYFIVYPCPIKRKNKLYYGIQAVNIKTEKISKPMVYVPIGLLVEAEDKKRELLELKKYKDKLIKKLIKTQGGKIK